MLEHRLKGLNRNNNLQVVLSIVEWVRRLHFYSDLSAFFVLMLIDSELQLIGTKMKTDSFKQIGDSADKANKGKRSNEKINIWLFAFKECITCLIFNKKRLKLSMKYK